MTKAGAERMKYKKYVFRVKNERNKMKRSRMKKALRPRDIKCSRCRIAVLRAASCFAAFCSLLARVAEAARDHTPVPYRSSQINWR